MLSGSLAGTFYALKRSRRRNGHQRPGDPPDAWWFPATWAEQAKAQGTTILSKGGEGMNLEAIAALQPDLIVGGGQGITSVQARNVSRHVHAELAWVQSMGGPLIVIPVSALDQWGGMHRRRDHRRRD